jgi:hypothetical protein
MERVFMFLFFLWGITQGLENLPESRKKEELRIWIEDEL